MSKGGNSPEEPRPWGAMAPCLMSPEVEQCGWGEPEGYSPPLVANGDIAFRVGPFGDNTHTWADLAWTPPIYRAGRRYGSEDSFKLVSFGNYRIDLTVEGVSLNNCDSWRQQLDYATGRVVSEVRFPGGIAAKNTLAIDFDASRLFIRREIIGAGGIVRQSLSYRGEVCTVDDITAEWMIEWRDDDTSSVKRCSADAELMRIADGWRRFWDKSLPPPAICRSEALMYVASLYHLRCNATKWSQPVGISNDTWAGRFFGWDEYFCQLGLLYSGHDDLARRVPEFRKSVLPQAQARIGRYLEAGGVGARYPWETLENGREGTPPGFWQDHIFHESNIAAGAWEQYVVTKDLTYLKETAWPVMRDMARFFLEMACYDDGHGGLYIGKVTDLERLGPAKERAFMTTVGAMYTFRIAALAADAVGECAAEAVHWRDAEKRLRGSLPEKDGRYVALPGGEEESVATVAGYFPYPYFSAHDDKALAALKHFETVAKTAGNMYPIGENVCTWYAAWLSAAASKAGEKEMACRWLSEAAATQGCFGEAWEIKEGKVRSRPWFATASGMYLVACGLLR